MSENPKNYEFSKFNESLSENEKEAFLSLSKMTNTEAMVSKINRDPTLTNLVSKHFKEWNQNILSNYSAYGISVRTLQDKLVKEGFYLWPYWNKWVDWEFWPYTFVAILKIQKALWQKASWVANLDLLKFIFPKTFKTLNKNEWRNIVDTKKYVDQKIKNYNEFLKETKIKLEPDTKKDLENFVKDSYKKEQAKTQEKSDSNDNSDKSEFIIKLLNYYDKRGKSIDVDTKVKRKNNLKTIKDISRTNNWFYSYEKQDNFFSASEKLANYALKNWAKTATNYCWKWVWNTLNNFWVKWLPDRRRDWYKWSEFLDNNPSFIKVKINNIREARKWAILVYDKWFWPTKARRNYWHVEIKITDNKFFYWMFDSAPGWSVNAYKQKSWFTWYAYYLKPNYKSIW